MIKRDTILKTVRAELQDIGKRRGKKIPAIIPEKAHFVHDLLFDSLDIVDFICRLELIYQIEVKDEEIDPMFNVGLVADFVIDRLTVNNALTI